jgi:hypothetical protein
VPGVLPVCFLELISGFPVSKFLFKMLVQGHMLDTFFMIFTAPHVTFEVFNLLVQLLIFSIELFVGTYMLSSHARLEAFVIQTKLN